MSSPWAKIATPEPVNLEDIMSEELAKDLREKENKKCSVIVQSVEEDFVMIPELLEEEELMKSDKEITKMLQQEYDNMLKLSEDVNEAAKVSIPFSNYRNLDFDSDNEPEEIEDIRDKKDWDKFENVMRDFDAIPACGYRNVNGNIVTKQDVAISGLKNACKMLSFPPEFETGDGAGFDMKISNKVFNSLKMHSKHEQWKKHDKKEDQETAVFSIDTHTRFILYKMINDELLDQVNGVISIGEEAAILHADTNPEYKDGPIPKECAIKLFKTTLFESEERDKYIRDDYRFRSRFGKTNGKIRTSKLVQLWAEKEMDNLRRLRKAGILCPEVVALKKHVLVMSFIGRDNHPAPKIKDVLFDDVNIMIAYEQIIQYMKTMFEECHLIHTDLSEYNILWYDNNCYIIDVSQAVEPSHENALHFLYRDCENICTFFSKYKVPNVFDPLELFQHVSGCSYMNRVAMAELQETFKTNHHLVHRPGVESTYNFDTISEKLQAEKFAVQSTSSIECLPLTEVMQT